MWATGFVVFIILELTLKYKESICARPSPQATLPLQNVNAMLKTNLQKVAGKQLQGKCKHKTTRPYCSRPIERIAANCAWHFLLYPMNYIRLRRTLVHDPEYKPQGDPALLGMCNQNR
mmetsp:Transcript_4408/g.9811  ORF Transcript_4408/g.9811 Transcript_4408/m.9811 type:complete len:118 (+) Transcript_4408:240-593(+)